MIVIAILIGCIIGAVIGMNSPVIPYTYSIFLAIAVVAALDSVFGGITSVLKKNFDLTIFRSKTKFRYIFSSIGSICWKNVYKLNNNKKTLY